jgi:Ca2+-binding EF-hand superfamily protein
MDKDGDGYLDFHELDAQMREEMLHRLENHGSFAKIESEKAFNEIDKNKDGKVKKAEYLKKYSWLLEVSERDKKGEDAEAKANRLFITDEFKWAQKKFKFGDVNKDGECPDRLQLESNSNC